MTLKPEDHALIARLMARQPSLMLRGHEGYYRHEDIIEAVQLIGRLAAAREESRPDPRPSPVGREEVARVIASALGDDFDHAFVNKSEWNRERGEKGGRYRDINEPMRDDYLAAAQVAIAMIAASPPPPVSS